MFITFRSDLYYFFIKNKAKHILSHTLLIKRDDRVQCIGCDPAGFFFFLNIEMLLNVYIKKVLEQPTCTYPAPRKSV